MMLTIPGLLPPEELVRVQEALHNAPWNDGRVTAGYQSRRVKRNSQLDEGDPLARRLGDIIMARLERTPLFVSAALPLKLVPPVFNRYEADEGYGDHIDGAIRSVPGTPIRVRNDLAATIFLAEPETYDGGDLVIETGASPARIKLKAGDMILYAAGGLHRVDAVTRGTRYAVFFWVQSMVRDLSCRTMLFELDGTIQRLATVTPDHPEIVGLTQLYHQLLRHWAET